ncbi:MAG: hypothetical protein ACR2M0_00315 [Chloroflexia bacterium]
MDLSISAGRASLLADLAVMPQLTTTLTGTLSPGRQVGASPARTAT